MREIFIENSANLQRIAVRVNKKLTECLVQDALEAPMPGQIYMGVVKNIIPGMKSAFIDIGYKKNGYMYLDSKFNNTSIKKGQELLVEIVKEESGDKGPKVTNAISLPGRYSVLTTLDNKISVSKKVSDITFYNKLNTELIKPDEIGITIRTNAYESKVPVEEINNEIAVLHKKYVALLKKAEFVKNPCLLYSDDSILDKILRDIKNNEAVRLYTDNADDFQSLKNYTSDNFVEGAEVILHSEQRQLFSYYGIEKELLQLRGNKVFLRCGGYIVIEKTEAAWVIDVNTGKNISGRSIEETVLTTNLEAAEELSRQIKLRNLSGIIIVDFIDMLSEKNKSQAMDVLMKGFAEDKNKAVIYPFTELNLVQIARRRRGRSVLDFMEENCSSCSGKGNRLSYQYILHLIKNEILQIEEARLNNGICIEISKVYKENILGDKAAFLKAIEIGDEDLYVKFVERQDFYKIDIIIFESQLKRDELIKINS